MAVLSLLQGETVERWRFGAGLLISMLGWRCLDGVGESALESAVRAKGKAQGSEMGNQAGRTGEATASVEVGKVKQS